MYETKIKRLPNIREPFAVYKILSADQFFPSFWTNDTIHTESLGCLKILHAGIREWTKNAVHVDGVIAEFVAK